jgi:predicted esterase
MRGTGKTRWRWRGRDGILFFSCLSWFIFCNPQLEARHFKVEDEKIVVKTVSARQKKPELFFLEASLSVEEAMPLGKTYARAYFFDARGKQIGAPVSPIPEQYDKKHPPSQLPFYFKKDDSLKIRFPAPENIARQAPYWRAVIVFGDEKDATAALVAESKTRITKEFAAGYDFPERALCAKESPPRQREDARLTEIRCRTSLPDYPHFTLFARLPDGIKRGSDAKGVLCLSLLANHVEEVRLALERNEAKGEFAEMLRFADKEQLLVICWGTRNLWDPSRNWDELDADVARRADARFDRVAVAWEHGVKRLAAIYKFEPGHFFLCGFSGSAQYAMRLALRKPGYFNAVFLHIPSSFDKPVPEGANVLWCLATGELESGYRRSQRFYRQCIDMGYPFIYKAVPSLGHRSHAPSMKLGLAFFEYAKTLPKDEKMRRDILEKHMGDPLFWGDWLNNSVVKKESGTFVPNKLRVALPNEKIAMAWEMKTGNRSPMIPSSFFATANRPVPPRPTPSANAAAGTLSTESSPKESDSEYTVFGRRIKEKERP